jgi:hypothetical protein
MYQMTALQIIQQTAAELGLPVPSSAVTSKETTATQLLALLNTAGYELSHSFEWQQLVRKATITTSIDSEYDLPTDFNKMINQTIWSSDSLQPIEGPLSPQRWELRTEGTLGTSPFLGFRIAGNKLVLSPAPVAGGEITFEYISNGWVNSYLDPTVYTQYVLNDKDVPQFDFILMVKFLKVKMWNAKGLDSTALESEFRLFYDMMTSQNKSSPILLVSPRRRGNIPFNTPETGYGL